MKHQIQNKIFDLCAQLVCALLPLTLSWYNDEYGLAFWAYGSVGLCQLVSFAANIGTHEEYCEVGARKIYETILKVLLIAALISLISIATPVAIIALYYLFIMLIVGVIMAVFYFGITIAELRKLLTVQSKLNNEL
jgi:hypothetical protein